MIRKGVLLFRSFALLLIFACSVCAADAAQKSRNRETPQQSALAEHYSVYWLQNCSTATDIKYAGSTMRVFVNFQHKHAVKVIHDPTLKEAARKIGIKRVEFHDWSGFSKEYIYYSTSK